MGVTCSNCGTDNTQDSEFCKKCGTQIREPEEKPLPTQTLESPKEELTTGSTFAGRYQIIEELGKGGMGKVYRALDKKLNEEVALKLIKPAIASDKKTLERFQNELKLARKIRHSNVGGMYELLEDKGLHYITMEYVSGEDLKSFIRRSGRLTINKAINIANQICEGLTEAHKLGVVHRDLKPSNIMIDKDGNARIMDFGIARSLKGKGITGAGVMIGTPEYMSPEQVEGKEVDQRADIYSLGVILYEMVTGKIPFEGDTPFSIGVKQKSETPRPPKEINEQIPEDLNHVILKCMEKDKENRFWSVEELHSELMSLEKGVPTTERIVPERKPLTSKEITVTFNAKKLILPALVVTIVAAVGLLIWNPWSQEDISSTNVGTPSVAVLPFEDLSPQKDQGYLCDGFAESLINALTTIEDLRVPAPTSSFVFRDREVDLKELGEKLNVKTVLRGSVQMAGNRIRIIARLIMVADETILWSKQYNRELDDIFAIQDEISFSIADNLKLELLGEEKSKVAKRYTENVEAYSLYLRGRFFLNKRNEEGFTKAKEYFEQAIDEDPEFALAYSGLADTYSLFHAYGILEANEVFPKAKSLAETSLKIDNMLAEAHNSLGWIKFINDRDWEGAEREFKRSIELNPGYANAHHWYALYLMWMARSDQAFREIKKAQELDPLSFMINRDFGRAYLYTRQYDKAIEVLKNTIEMNPEFRSAHNYLGQAYLYKSMYKEALAEFQFTNSRTNLGIAYAYMGENEKAYEILDEFINLYKKDKDPSILEYIALLCFALGEIDQGFQYMGMALEEKGTWIINYINVAPILDNVRSDPRFKEILKKINLEY